MLYINTEYLSILILKNYFKDQTLQMKFKKGATWTERAWQKIGSIVRITTEENSVGKRPLRRPRLRREDCVKVDVGKIQPEVPWRIAAEDR